MEEIPQNYVTTPNDKSRDALPLTVPHGYLDQRLRDSNNKIMLDYYQSNHEIDEPIIHTVKLKEIKHKISSKAFSYVECENITTMWVEDYGFSYLTNYGNDQNYFFIKQDKGFNISEWNDSKTQYKINYETIVQFLFEVNSIFNKNSLVNKAEVKYYNKFKIFLNCGFVSLAVFFLSIIALILFDFTPIFVITLALSLFISLIFFTFSYVYRSADKFNLYEKNKAIIFNTPEFEGLFSKWNSQVFLQNGLYVIAPRNLEYLQFVLNPKIKFTIENHPYPYDILRTYERTTLAKGEIV